MEDSELKAYKSAWERLQSKVLDEKTGWGKEELKRRMDEVLIEELKRFLA